MIQIKRNNKVFFTLEDFGEGSKLSYQLMDHHYIILKFTTATPIYFEIGDSVEIPDFGYFELISSYFPKHNNSDGYDYEMQMDAYYMSWKNKICKYRPQHGANETSFNLTTTVGVHMNVILGNLKALGLTYNGKDFSVDYTTYNNKAFDIQKRFLIEYGSISILDALNAICSEDALNCEWWIDGSIIYLGYCEMEGQTTFEQDVNVLSMSYSESKSTYITRLYAFGSDRNIPKGYFTGADADVTTDGVSTDYLMLPNKEVDSDGFYAKDGYLENVNVVKNDKQAIEGVVMFEDEYPKVESVVSSIKTYDSTVDNEDGTKTTQTFWQVTATDSFATKFEASWIKSNLTLGIKFTSGALMGMEFDVSFKVIDNVNYFEIVANDTYGRTLPDGVMCPNVGDKFFLYNWDATKITDTDLIPTAQLSLFDRAKQYYQKTMISNANFTCTMDGDKFYNNGTYDYHPLGEQVKLINDMFAQVDADGKHYRNSRIIGMEIPLDIPYDHPQYTVGEKAATSRLGKLEDKVDSITVNGTQIGGIGSGNGGGGVYVIGMNDSTPPTDSNVLSARKSINSFLSKLTDDTTNGKITFIKGLIAKGLADLMMGAKFGNNAMITKLGEAVFSVIKSIDYDNAAEQGFSVEKEKNGKYHAFFTNLTIWGKARFHELEVRKLSYSGGNIYLSGAGSKLIKVMPVKQSVSDGGVTSWVEMTEGDAESECVGWKCYLLADNGTTATMNYWQEGDQARCQTMGEIAAGGAYSDVSNKSYWRTIPNGGVSTQNEKIYGTKTETYIDDDGNEQTRGVQVELYDGQAFAWIVIGKHCGDIDGYDDEFSVGYDGLNPAPLETRDIPSAGDTIVLDGNRHRNEHGEYDKTDRQNVIILETTGEYAPRIACYANITEYKHTITKRVNDSNKEVSLSVFETSPKGGTKINSSRFEWISDDGSTINIINYRGDWLSTNTYHKNDQVNHNNAVWVCVANSGVDVQEEPSDGATYWKKVISGVKGEDGLRGNGIVPAYVRSKDNPTPPTSTDKNNLDNGWSLAIPSVDDVENVSYSDSSWTDYNDGVHTWKKSPTTANNSTSWCLVTFTTTKANQAVMFVIKSFSETRYDYIFLSEINASDVPSKPDYKGASRAVSGNGVELSIIDVVATAGTHTVYICYGKDYSGDYYGDYGLFRIEKMTDIDIPLWQSNGKEVFTRDDSGEIKSEITSWSEPFKVTGEDGADGKDGTDGEQGESALEIIVTPETLVFDTNDYGLVPPETSKQASISCYRNGVKVTNVSYSKSAEENCLASVSESNGSATVTISRITSQEVADTSGNSSTISNTSGYATIQVWDKDTNLYHRVQVKFMVNVAKFTGQMVNTNKRFSLQHEELSNAVKDKVGSSELKKFKAEITQTARKISLSVSEKSIGRRNLLVGSAFLREDNNRIISNNARIEMNSGYNGTNCVKVIDDTDGTSHYIGVYWDGSQGGRSVKIEKGKKYTISCYYKTNDTNAKFSLEAIYTDKETNAKRLGRPKYLSPSSFNPKYNQWELFTTVIDTTDAESDYIAFNFWEFCNINVGRINAYICRPMVEEGDTYNGWTLSQDDYDYIGGNMLDNTLSLDKSGSLYDVNGTLTPAGFGESTSIYKSFVYKLKGTVDSFSQLPSSGNVYDDTYYVRNDGTCYAYNGSEFIKVTGNDSYYNILEWRKGKPGAFTSFGLEANKDYVFSFMAKGTGLLTAYFYNPDTDVFVESSLGATNISGNGNANFQLTNKWERYWVHWRPSDSLHKYVLLRLNRSFQSDGSAPITDCYIAQPKLEEGAMVTEYTERKSDLVDKASLKAAGIEITSDMVELYGNQVKVSGAKGGTPVAMFENGMLNSNLINADKIMARQLQTTGSNGQSVSIENGLMRVYGTNGSCNIEFGVNSNGEAILSYYDKDGKWLYDLGPNKLDGGQLTESTLDGDKYVTAASFFGTNDFFSLETYINFTVKQVRRKYSQRLFGNNLFFDEDQEVANNNSAHMGYKPFENVSESNVTNLYRYTAPRQSGTIIKDERYGLTTPAIAKQADGKYFTSNSVLAINGQLANLAPAGYYFRKSEQVKMAPYPMPSAVTQPVRFPAYSIRWLNITSNSTGAVMSGYNSMMSYLTRTIKIQN